MILVIGIAVLSSIAPTLVGYSDQTYDPRLTSVVYAIVAIVLTVLIDGKHSHRIWTTYHCFER